MKALPIDGRHKRYLIAFCLFIFSLAVLTVFGDKGLVDAYKISKERDGILARNESLNEKNKLLEEEIHLLKTDKRYIASIARKELGLLRPDELIYVTEE